MLCVALCEIPQSSRVEYDNLIHSTQPDGVIGTESSLTPKHFDNEIFRPYQGYTPFRRDRVGQNGGGVFVAVRNDIVVQEMKDIQSDCEDIWIKIDLFGSKSLLIGAYYKPHEHDQHMNSNMASERSALVNPSSSCWSMIFSNPSIRKTKLISFYLTSARPLIKSVTRNSLSNFMTMV